MAVPGRKKTALRIFVETTLRPKPSNRAGGVFHMDVGQWFMILDFVAWLLGMAGNAATCAIAIGVGVIAFKLKQA